ncbi:MAG: nucleoside triphosphate pyrophosphohydrolase [Treponema sp.]|nr:nucleoside triphosphate pyrophosphohydrolase [Treponema sp.]
MNNKTDRQNDVSSADTAAAFKRLYETIRTLRAPGGCPWDRDQTPLSMRSDLIEEVFEACDAVTLQDTPHVKEELGDVILNASLIAFMYEQNKDFTTADVLNELTGKLIRRHPHVFKQSEGSACMTGGINTSSEVISQWDKIKENIEGRKGGSSILDEVPEGFPPLLRAYKMQKKAGKKGFDWTTTEPVAAKVKEEFTEVQEAEKRVKEAITEADNRAEPLTEHSTPVVDAAQLHLEEEFGDLLFAVINYMRHLGIAPETAMDRANRKFYRRFSYVEQHMNDAGIPMNGEHIADEERLWEEAKQTGL